jgi:hypothetical protein
MKTLNKKEMRDLMATLIANGATVKTFAKIARIQAEQAIAETPIITILKDGTKETVNTAMPGDWIVTNPGGEKYVVPQEKFHKKYEPAPELGNGWYKPTGGVQKFLEMDEDIVFVCSWGEEQVILAGGYINVTNLDDIYGIAKAEFFETYKECDEAGNFIS